MEAFLGMLFWTDFFSLMIWNMSLYSLLVTRVSLRGQLSDQGSSVSYLMFLTCIFKYFFNAQPKSAHIILLNASFNPTSLSSALGAPLTLTFGLLMVSLHSWIVFLLYFVPLPYFLLFGYFCMRCPLTFFLLSESLYC